MRASAKELVPLFLRPHTEHLRVPDGKKLRQSVFHMSLLDHLGDETWKGIESRMGALIG